MAATALDSFIFCDIFTTPEMRRIFSDEARTGYCLAIEAALARAQARLGIIPENAAREIVRQSRIEKKAREVQEGAPDTASRVLDTAKDVAVGIAVGAKDMAT